MSTYFKSTVFRIYFFTYNKFPWKFPHGQRKDVQGKNKVSRKHNPERVFLQDKAVVSQITINDQLNDCQYFMTDIFYLNRQRSQEAINVDVYHHR